MQYSHSELPKEFQKNLLKSEEIPEGVPEGNQSRTVLGGFLEEALEEIYLEESQKNFPNEFLGGIQRFSLWNPREKLMQTIIFPEGIPSEIGEGIT